MDSLPWWVISLLSILGFLLILLLFPKLQIFLKKRNVFCTKDANPETCNLKKCPNLVKKDVSHLLILFIIVLAFLFSSPLYNAENAMDYFSFASTIASIILSVVAIIFSITGESRTEGLKRVLDNAIMKLEETNTNADAQKKIFEDILENSKMILVDTKSIREGVTSVKNTMESKVKDMSTENQKYESKEGWQSGSV